MRAAPAGKRRFYRRRGGWKTALRAAACVLAVLLIVAVLLFFGLQKHIVYTPEGVRLDIPFLEKYRAAEPAAAHYIIQRDN